MNLNHYFLLQLCLQNELDPFYAAQQKAMLLAWDRKSSHQAEPRLKGICNRLSPFREGGTYEMLMKDKTNLFVST